MKGRDTVKSAMRIARSLHWQISRESRGEALLPDILLGSSMAGEFTGLPFGSRCGRGDLPHLELDTAEKHVGLVSITHVECRSG